MSKPRDVGFLNVAPLIARIVVVALHRALTYPFRTVRCISLYNEVLFAAVRCMLHNITIPQSRYLNPSTSDRYLAYCQSQKIQPASLQVDTQNGPVAAHWLGDPEAKAVILYFHGGGYTQSVSDGHILYMARLVEDLNRAKGRRSVAVLMLAYTLVPEATHPTQLREAASVLSFLVNKTNRPPSNIFISGDSAGGNLGLALLSHLRHPHPAVPAIPLEQPLGGAMLYSPWAGFSTDYPSFDNVELDVLSPLPLRKWSAMFLGKANATNSEADPGPVSGDAYTEACKQPASWWNGMHDIVSDIFIAFGGDEVLADPIRELRTPLYEGWLQGGGDSSRVVFLEAPKEAHIAPILEVMTVGLKNKSDTQLAIEQWYQARLTGVVD